jgi:hypothetical protein
MSEQEWIDEAVKEFRRGCQQLQDELAQAANGTLLDVSDEQIMKNLEPLLRKVQQKAIQKALEKAQVDPDYRRCNKCKKKMRHKGAKAFEFITRRGNIKLSGTYYHCGCSNSKSISTLVSSGKKFSRIANELVTRYSASNSYQQASKYLRKDFNIYVSHEMLRQRISSVSGQIRQIRNSGDEAFRFKNLDGNRLYGYADGVLINITDEGWKECKLLRYEDEQCINISHRGLLGSINNFGRMTRREAINIGANHADEIVFLMDGAKGFHNHIKKNLPVAKQIVDYWHACQHIAGCSEILYPDNRPSASLWRTKYCHVLREQGANGLVGRLYKSKLMLSDADKLEAVGKLVRFLLSRSERMDYPALLSGGYRIDSGPIESSCKNVVQARMKCVGMRWSRHGASAMLEVRCALMSNLWEDVIRKCA